MTTLWAICQEQYFPLNLKITSEKTITQYRIAVRCFSESLGHEATVDDLHDDAITLWMGRLLRRKDRPLSVSTIRERVNRVLALWAWMARRGMIGRWPTVVKPLPPEHRPRAMSEDELRRLFRSASKERGIIGGVPADVWWTSLLAFIWCSAERKTAALSVRVEWVDFAQAVVTIPPATRKGKRKWGVYHLWPELVPLLQKAVECNPQREMMWPWLKCEGAFYTAFDRILTDAGIPNDRWHKAHGLRVSHATWLKIRGGDPTRQLMHSDPATTARHYIDSTKLPPEPNRLFIPWQDGPRGAA